MIASFVDYELVFLEVYSCSDCARAFVVGRDPASMTLRLLSGVHDASLPAAAYAHLGRKASGAGKSGDSCPLGGLALPHEMSWVPDPTPFASVKAAERHLKRMVAAKCTPTAGRTWVSVYSGPFLPEYALLQAQAAAAAPVGAFVDSDDSFAKRRKSKGVKTVTEAVTGRKLIRVYHAKGTTSRVEVGARAISDAGAVGEVVSTSALYTDVSVTADYSPEAVEGDGWQAAWLAEGGAPKIRLGVYLPEKEHWWPEEKGETVFVKGDAWWGIKTEDEGHVSKWSVTVRSGVRGGAPSLPSDLMTGFPDAHAFRVLVEGRIRRIEERGYVGVWNGR